MTKEWSNSNVMQPAQHGSAGSAAAHSPAVPALNSHGGASHAKLDRPKGKCNVRSAVSCGSLACQAGRPLVIAIGLVLLSMAVYFENARCCGAKVQRSAEVGWASERSEWVGSFAIEQSTTGGRLPCIAA